MTGHTTLLYVRTPTGRAAAFSPDANLTVSLKTLLKAVDGKASVTALVIQFPDLDAAELLTQLEKAGLIKLREERLHDFQVAVASPEHAFAQPAMAPDIAPLVVTTTPEVAALPAVLDVPATGLAKIVDLMSTFVLTYFPQQSFTVLAKLEGFKTLGELQAELPEYAALAKASGPAGLVHLADVTERVREAAAA